MTAPMVYGPAYSTYVRTVFMTLQEKGTAYKHIDVDIMKGENRTPDYLRRQPFGKVPAFEHDGFAIYETGAIVRYIDEAFSGPALQPADAKIRARMNQAISVIDNYAYGAIIGHIVMQRLIAPLLGASPDETVISEGLPLAEQALTALQDLLGTRTRLAGDELTLADLYLVPVYEYFAMTPEGTATLPKFPAIREWWRSLETRDSVVSTRPKVG
ncbi:MAG: glutathione S-transferase family protein [Rhodospirillales bacterium]|nr:glutathione S-transferase family protein [Rhodospirillales bacterium]